MTQVQLSPAGRALSVSLPAALFYVGAAAVMIILAFIGFADFYLHGMAFPNRPITPAVKAIVIVHAVTMSLWLGLLLLQPILVRIGHTRIHRQVGVAGSILAVLVLVFGVLLSVRSAQVSPPDNILYGLAPKPFMAIPLLTVVVFSCFVAAGVLYRRKPAIHRSMMVVGTLAAMSAAISRITPLNNLYLGTPLETAFGPYWWTLVLGVVLVVTRCALTKSIDRPLVIGFTIMAIALTVIMHLAQTRAWLAIATALAG